jgi:hypothetical protein
VAFLDSILFVILGLNPRTSAKNYALASTLLTAGLEKALEAHHLGLYRQVNGSNGILPQFLVAFLRVGIKVA